MAENICMRHQIKKKGDILHGSIYLRQQQRITQHKRFVPYGTHLNFCFAKISSMLGTLSEIVDEGT